MTLLCKSHLYYVQWLKLFLHVFTDIVDRSEISQGDKLSRC